MTESCTGTEGEREREQRATVDRNLWMGWMVASRTFSNSNVMVIHDTNLRPLARPGLYFRVQPVAVMVQLFDLA